jgi:hypothetical protein
VRFHKIKNYKDAKISAFYFDKQKFFVPNAMKLCNSCKMMFVVSNYLYVVTPTSLWGVGQFWCQKNKINTSNIQLKLSKIQKDLTTTAKKTKVAMKFG